MAMAESTCWQCGSPLTFEYGGWVHEGGTQYMSRCGGCSWEGPEPRGGVCPLCDSPDLRDTCVGVPIPVDMTLAETRAAVQAIDYEDAWGR